MLFILLALIFIRPFISSLAFPYINSIYSILLLGFLCIWLMRSGLKLNKIGAAKIPLLLFVLAIFTSLVFSQNKTNSFLELYKYLTGIMLFIGCINLSDDSKKRVISFIITSAVIISVLAIYQYFFGFKHLLNYMTRKNINNYFAMLYITQKRIFFPFVTPNILGGYLAMVIPLALYLKNRLLFILPLLFTLLLTKSLGAILSFSIGMGVYFYLQGRLKKRNIVYLIIMLTVIGIVFMLRMANKTEYLQPVFSTLMRLNYWQDTLRIIGGHPLMGVGLGNFDSLRSTYTHNSFLQIWAEVGIFSLITFLWFVFVVFKSGLRKIYNSPDKNYIAGLIAANAVFLIHNITDFSFFLPEVVLLWWVLLGVLFSAR